MKVPVEHLELRELEIRPGANTYTPSHRKTIRVEKAGMSNVVLVVHLILALVLIGIVLLQRSEGGGLGIGGGAGNILSGRGALTGLGKLTWLFAVLFLGTSIFLTILSASNQTGDSVIDRLEGTVSTEENTTVPGLNLDELTTQPDQPATPPKAE